LSLKQDRILVNSALEALPAAFREGDHPARDRGAGL
jgi:hypothetical protein